jgi:hypothetical protein
LLFCCGLGFCFGGVSLHPVRVAMSPRQQKTVELLFKTPAKNQEKSTKGQTNNSTISAI